VSISRPLLLPAGLLLVGANLRIGVACVSPVLDDIRSDLALTPTEAGILTSIPVFAFGLFAFLTPGLVARLGLHRLIGATMAVLALGILLRLDSTAAALFAGTLLVGASIAIANVAVPAAVKQDLPGRIPLMMGLYSTALAAGAALASGLTVPLAHVMGSWRSAIALWALPAVAALAIWAPNLRRAAAVPHPRPAGATDPASMGRLLRDPVAWAVTGFMGFQSTSYYATLAWIPTLLRDHGVSANTAGLLLAYSSAPSVVASLIAPVLAHRLRSAAGLIWLTCLVYGAGYVGLALAPASGAMAWMTLLGLAQGASISLALSFLAWRSPDARHAAHLSTVAQGAGYLLAGIGPLGLGLLHAWSGGWGWPLAALGLLLVAQLVTGVAASRDRYVLGSTPASV